MNFMEKGNTSRDIDCYYGEDNLDPNNTEIRLITTNSTTNNTSQLGEDLINPVFSSTNWASSSFSSSSSSTTTPLVSSPPNNLYQQQQQQQQYVKYTTRSGTGIQTRTSQLDFMDASPAPSEEAVVVEREHMFDKVVTPSDVGKLNRLVIPKQHAEKYFPLDSSTNDKGLLLNFEDVATTKLWRFRYSYWNSSQSYVMTKGWSRFVKEKKLDPGDMVSFHRAKAKLDRLFIDCTHRPPPPQLINSSIPFSGNMNFSIHPSRYFPGNRSSPTMLGWSNSTGPTGIILPAHAATPLRGGGGDQYYHPVSHNPNWRTNGYNNNYYGGNTNYSHNHPSGNSVVYYKASSSFSPHQHHHQIQQQEETSSSGMMRYASLGSGEMGSEGVDRQLEQVLLHSVPVVQGKAAAKRLRLFGVNMDCPISNNGDDDDDDVEDITILPSTTIGLHHNINAGATLLIPPPSTSIAHLVQLRLNNNTSGPSSSHHHHSQFQSD